MSNEDLKQVRPLGDRVLIKRTESNKGRKYGSIHIPDAANEIDLSWEAEVVAVGPGRELKDGTMYPPDVKPGDKIKIGKYTGTEVKLNDETYYVVRSDDILGVVEEE